MVTGKFQHKQNVLEWLKSDFVYPEDTIIHSKKEGTYMSLHNRVLSCLLIFSMSISLVACTSSSSITSEQQTPASTVTETTTPTETKATEPEKPQKLELTDKMISEIEDKFSPIKGLGNVSSADFLICGLASFETIRYGHSVTFNDYTVARKEKTDKYTYTIYGYVYGEDKFGDKYKSKYTLTYTAIEDAEEENGYKLDPDLKLILD